MAQIRTKGHFFHVLPLHQMSFARVLFRDQINVTSAFLPRLCLGNCLWGSTIEFASVAVAIVRYFVLHRLGSAVVSFLL